MGGTGSTASGSLAQRERRALGALLSELGPDAPTLCGEWTTRDLAAHIALRERRPDAALGIAVAPLARWTRRVQAGYAAQPYPRVVELVRGGPPRLSVFALPAVDRAANTIELFVHHEDVRRAQDGWSPRALPAADQERLWRRLSAATRALARGAPCEVVLRTPAGRAVTVGGPTPGVIVTGEPAELLLFAFGRQHHARVTMSGDDALVERLMAASLSV